MNSQTIRKLTLFVLVSSMILSVFSIGLSQESNSHVAAAENTEQAMNELNENLNAQKLKHNLALSNQMVHFLIKKYADNARLRDYLKMYKKKKLDENFQEDEEDYNYPTRFRF